MRTATSGRPLPSQSPVSTPGVRPRRFPTTALTSAPGAAIRKPGCMRSRADRTPGGMARESCPPSGPIAARTAQAAKVRTCMWSSRLTVWLTPAAHVRHARVNDSTAREGRACARPDAVRCSGWLACSRAAAEGDDVAVGVLDVEVLRAPGRGCECLDDGYSVGDALFVERFDAIDARRGVGMLIVAAPLAIRLG